MLNMMVPQSPSGRRQVFVPSPFKPSQSEMSAAARNLGEGAGSRWEGKVHIHPFSHLLAVAQLYLVAAIN